MWSSLAETIAWASERLGVRVGSYPPADGDGDFAVVQRVGGDTSYPHDSPRIAIQVWTDSDANGEQVALALARVLPTLADRTPRINAIERESTITQLGRDESGHYVWQLVFTMHCNIRSDN
jgi:hypothetical protein